jgi:sulfur carrier protein ThiS adenylyltransferase
MEKEPIKDRDIRQRDLVPPERLAECKASVIGVGAIGRQVALQLAAMGIPWLQLVDPDVVAPENLACQGYHEENLDNFKVEATANQCWAINPNVEIWPLCDRFKRSMKTGNVIFCCVDKIDTRNLIWEAVNKRVSFFADGRMSAEVLRVLVAADKISRNHYPTTLFAQEEAYASSCTAKSTIFCANIAAGMMLEQFSRWLRKMPIEADICLNLLASELTVNSGR